MVSPFGAVTFEALGITRNRLPSFSAAGVTMMYKKPKLLIDFTKAASFNDICFSPKQVSKVSLQRFAQAKRSSEQNAKTFAEELNAKRRFKKASRNLARQIRQGRVRPILLDKPGSAVMTAMPNVRREDIGLSSKRTYFSYEHP